MPELRLAEHSLSLGLAPIIATLVEGVTEFEGDPSATIPELEGPDGGLYLAMTSLAISLDERVVDDDNRTKDILIGDRKGLRHRFYGGFAILIKQGSPLAMTQRLAHELSHRYTEPVLVGDNVGYTHGETVAEGSAFVVCGHFGLDISAHAFPYIAGYNGGNFTSEMVAGIQTASTGIIEGLRAGIT